MHFLDIEAQVTEESADESDEYEDIGDYIIITETL